MATKVLQTPQIIEIIGSTIKIAHPDISGNARTSVASPILAGGTTLTVLDNNRFSDNDYLIIGNIGVQETEEVDVNGTVTRGTSLTVTNTLKFDHEVNNPVTKIFERGIRIYGAATDGGVGTLIASINAIVAPIADATMIQWNKAYTEYDLISTDTAYPYYFVKFTDGTTDSPASNYAPATGLTSNSVYYMIQQALDLVDAKLDSENITLEQCVRWANDAQTEISQYMYDDPRAGYVNKDWTFEEYEDPSLTISENENEYDITGLGLKRINTNAVIEVSIGAGKTLKQVRIQDIKEKLGDKPKTTVTVEATTGDTTLTVASNIEFEDSGTLYVGSDTVTYTGKSGTTGFTGIPASGDGSITDTHAVGAPVWQNIAPGTPEEYTIFNGKLILTTPPDEDFVGQSIKIKFFKLPTVLTKASDVTTVPFYNVFQYYIASKIEQKRRNTNEFLMQKAEFEKRVLNNALSDQAPMTDSYTYYNYEQL